MSFTFSKDNSHFVIIVGRYCYFLIAMKAVPLLVLTNVSELYFWALLIRCCPPPPPLSKPAFGGRASTISIEGSIPKQPELGDFSK